MGSRDFGGNLAVQDGVELRSHSHQYLFLASLGVDLADPRVGVCVKVVPGELVVGEFDDLPNRFNTSVLNQYLEKRIAVLVELFGKLFADYGLFGCLRPKAHI